MFLAAFIQVQRLDLLSPSSRPTFKIYGKEYQYKEVPRRIQRAKASGHWPQVFNIAIPQPDHIEIIPARAGSTEFDASEGDNHQNSRDTTLSIHSIDQEGQTDYFQAVLQDNPEISIALPNSKELQMTERLCYNISSYLTAARRENLFISNDAGQLVSRSFATSFTNLNDFHKCCIVAVELLSRGYGNQGCILLNRALELVKTVLFEQDPKLLDVLCDLCILFPTKGMARLYDLLKDMLCGLIEIKFAEQHGQEHPWVQIFACIRRLSSTDIVATLQQSWKCGYDSMERLFPEDPWDTINISCYSNHRLRIGANEKHHWDALLNRSSQQHQSDVCDTQRRFACGKILYLKGDYHESLEVMERIISQCFHARQQDELKWIPMEIEALEVSARCHFAIHKLTRNTREISIGENLLGNAMELSRRTRDPGSVTTIALQHTLWLWLLEQGRIREANLLRKRIDSETTAAKSL
jgi:hypothetical protein